jgi:basic membrane protein A
MSSKLRVLSLLAAISLLVAACAPVATPAPTTGPTQPAAETPTSPAAEIPTTTAETSTTAPTSAGTPAANIKVCQVTDQGGIDDKSFNTMAWKGVQDAIDKLGIQGKYLESKQESDYEKNIDAMLTDNCDLIITVGFLLEGATKTAAQANPNQKFAIVDVSYDPPINNVLGQVFASDQGAFMAGYLSAGVTKTGKVGTFGGMQIPPVTLYLDGFVYGVRAYNAKHGTHVQAVGWDPDTQTGLFTGNFSSLDDGKRAAQSLIAEGVDIIMPGAGAGSLGAGTAAKEAGNVYLVGVDADWFNTAPEFANIELTSVLKRMDVAVYDAIQQVIQGTFKGDTYVGTLQNGGMDLAPYHNLESMVPQSLRDELAQVRADIIAGKVKTSPHPLQ